MPSRKSLLLHAFRAAVEAVDPARLVASALRVEGDSVVLDAPGVRAAIPLSSLWNIHLVGAGKAGRAMGTAALAALGKRVAGGVIAVPRGAEGQSGPVRFAAAGHPVPDIFSLAAAREALSLLEQAGKGDLVIALVSGGGSAMLSAPAEGITTEEKAETFRLLLRAGADIASFNAVRKHLSEVKGGLLARAAQPATTWALLLSDVPGDDPSVIASGPFSPDPTTYADAIGVLERYGIFYAVPSPVRQHLSEGAAGSLPETPKPDDPAFLGTTSAIVGTNRTAMEAARRTARGQVTGSTATALLPGFLRGEARECARSFCTGLRKAAEALSPGHAVVVIAGSVRGFRGHRLRRGGKTPQVVPRSFDTDGAQLVGREAGDLVVLRHRFAQHEPVHADARDRLDRQHLSVGAIAQVQQLAIAVVPDEAKHFVLVTPQRLKADAIVFQARRRGVPHPGTVRAV